MADLPTLTRNELFAIFKNEKIVRAFESLILALKRSPDQLAQVIEDVALVRDIAERSALGSFQRLPEEKAIRPGSGVQVARDAGGVTLSIDEAVVAAVARTYAQKQEPAPQIDSAQIVLLSRSFGGRGVS
jgi:hypothetical protein